MNLKFTENEEKKLICRLTKKLKNFLLNIWKQSEKAARSWKKDADALFLSRQGSRLTTRAIQNLIKKYTSIAMETSRSKGYSPHKLRATAASSMIEFGFSIYDVQNLLDHDSVLTTQLYAAHRKNAKKEIIESLNWIK